jgi:RNA polymerase sigma-70 factor (ECF subfamily)
LEPVLNQMVVLKYYWNLTDQEIAETLQVPLGTVKSSLYRARRLLEKKLTSFGKEYFKRGKERELIRHEKA